MVGGRKSQKLGPTNFDAKHCEAEAQPCEDYQGRSYRKPQVTGWQGDMKDGQCDFAILDYAKLKTEAMFAPAAPVILEQCVSKDPASPLLSPVLLSTYFPRNSRAEHRRP